MPTRDMKRRTSRGIAIRIAELRRLIVYWRKHGCPQAREQSEIKIKFWEEQ
jgi:hypothetical protein